MSDSTTTTELRHSGSDQQPRKARRRSYLPSAQVVEELSSVKDLTALAEELRVCLTDSGD